MRALLDNLPTALGYNKELDRLIALVLSNMDRASDYMVALSTYMDIRVTYLTDFTIRARKRHTAEGFSTRQFRNKVHVYKKLFNSSSDNICYCKENALSGYPIYPNQIESWEPQIKKIYFRNFEEFKKRFDLKFITEGAIKDLWDRGSGMHDGGYTKRDFRRISKNGKLVIKRFLENFEGIHPDTPNTWGDAYQKSSFGHYGVLHNSYVGTNRAIRIEHSTQSPYVHYTNERSTGGRERHGLLVNKNTYLWVEDD